MRRMASLRLLLLVLRPWIAESALWMDIGSGEVKVIDHEGNTVEKVYMKKFDDVRFSPSEKSGDFFN